MHGNILKNECGTMEHWRNWDMLGLTHNVNLNGLKQFLVSAPTKDLIAVYKSLCSVTDLCLRFANIPAVTLPLSELSFAYSLELSNRFLVNGEDIGTLAIDIMHINIT